MKTGVVFLLAALLLLPPAGATPPPPGLHAGPGGTVRKAGRPYRGIGVNYFDCFLRTLKDGGDTSYAVGFAALAAQGIPFARFCATGFWPKDMELYQNPEPIDAISVHAYGEDSLARFDWLRRAAQRLGQPVFVGEFGVKAVAKSEAEQRAEFQRFLRRIVAAGFPLAALWVYDYPRQEEWSITATNARAWQLAAVAAVNRSLR